MATQQQAGSSAQREPFVNPLNFTAAALRGVSQFYDIQMAATRTILQSQAETAAAFGFPDYSQLFSEMDERTKHMFEDGAEQILNAAQQATDTLNEVQRQVGRLVEAQSMSIAESWQRSVEEFGVQANEGLNQLSETARIQAKEAKRSIDQISEQTRESLRQGAEQTRQAFREGSQQARQFTEEQSQATRATGERALEATHSTVKEAGQVGDKPQEALDELSRAQQASGKPAGSETPPPAGRKGKT